MDNETKLMLEWVETELATYTETLEQVQAHIVELEMLKAEIKKPQHQPGLVSATH